MPPLRLGQHGFCLQWREDMAPGDSPIMPQETRQSSLGPFASRACVSVPTGAHESPATSERMLRNVTNPPPNIGAGIMGHENAGGPQEPTHP